MLHASSNYAFGDFSNNPAAAASVQLSAEPRKFEKTYYMPNQQDKMINHLRAWIHKRAGDGVKWGAAGAMQPLPPRMPNSDVFDNYHVHTKHCTHCLKALKNTVLLRNLALVMAVASLTLFKSVSVWVRLGAASLFAFLANKQEKQRDLFYKYEFSHQEND